MAEFKESGGAFSFWRVVSYLVAGVLAAGAQIIHTEVPSWWRPFAIMCVFILAVSLPVLVDWLNSRNEKIKAKKLVQFNENLSGALLSLQDYLARGKDDAEAAKYFRKKVLDAGSQLFSYSGLRLCLYLLDTREVEGADNKTYLVLDASHGRYDYPRVEFTPDTEHGRFVLKVAKGSTPRAFSKIHHQDARFDRSPGTVWQSFMVFPVRSAESQRPFAALFVDSQDHIKWTTEDRSIGSALAYMISLTANKNVQINRRKTAEKEESITELIHRMMQSGSKIS